MGSIGGIPVALRFADHRATLHDPAYPGRGRGHVRVCDCAFSQGRRDVPELKLSGGRGGAARGGRSLFGTSSGVGSSSCSRNVVRAGPASSAVCGVERQRDVLGDRRPGLQPVGDGETLVPARGLPELAGEDDAAAEHPAIGDAGAARARTAGVVMIVMIVGELAVVARGPGGARHRLSP